MIEYRHVAARLFNRPLLLTQDSAHAISAFMLTRMRGPMAGGMGGGEDDAGETRQYFRGQERADGSFEFHAPRASRFYGDYPVGENGRPMPFRRTDDGTAIITLVGEWVNRGAWVGASSGLISYEGFKYQLARAVADPKTARIVLDMESPGGEAVGAFEAAAAVREAAEQKEVVAVVNGLAASAMYAIASGATRIVTMPTGLSGSIGVVWLHLDFSAWLKEEGIKPTFIFAGDHKVDGNPFEPLPDAVRKDAQAEIDSLYAQFVDTVVAGRGISAEAVRATQARVFKGQEAVDAGLADEVGTFEDVLSDFSSAPSGRNPRNVSMADKTTAPAADAGNITAEAHQAAITSAQTSAKAEGEKTGATAAQTRIKTILTSPEAKGREKLAEHFAFNTAMSAEDAVAALAVSAKEKSDASAPKTSKLDALMPNEAQPLVDAGTGSQPDHVAGLSAAVTRQLAALGKKPLALN